MNKKTIFFIVGLLWCFVIGLFGLLLYGQTNFGWFSSVVSNSSKSVLSEVKPIALKPVTILAFGDMMLDRKVREQIDLNGPEYPFALIKDFLRGDATGNANDIVVANAEGPFTYNNSLTVGVKDGPLQFTFDPALLPTLKDLGFTLLDQANNHTLNFGMAGFRQSTSSIEKAGLNWFGDPRNQDVTPYIAEVRDEKLAFIGYNEFAQQGLKNVLQAIQNAKDKVSFVVVYAHWGNEYEMNATSTQIKTAHSFIDAGADVVIGSHPHVIQPIENYKNKFIFYSLGNFIFDQANTGPTTRGLAVKISLTPENVTYDLFPISILNQQSNVLVGEERQKDLEVLEVPNGEMVLPRNISDLKNTSNSRIIQIGNIYINAELATTEAEQIQGLSSRTSLAPNAGMFFVFGYDSGWGIWMKDMNFPIDVLWITDDLKISDIVENMTPESYPKAYMPHVPVRYVLELPAGTVKNGGFTVGQSVILK